MSARCNVAVVQRVLTDYRGVFFRHVDRLLASHGVSVSLIAGTPSRSFRSRGQHLSASVKTRRVRLGTRELIWMPGLRKRIAHANVIVCEYSAGNLSVLRLALRPHRYRLVLWGHDQDRQRAEAWVVRRVKGALLRRADRFLCYSPSVAQALVSRGLDPHRLTVVPNVSDTTALRASASAVTTPKVPLRALFVGSLHEGRMLPLLLESASLVRETLPGFELFIVGDGPLASWLCEAIKARDGVHWVGRAGPALLGRMLASSQIAAIPGMVGLNAVDALVAGVPVVTVRDAGHSPEADYLTERNSVFASAATPEDYSAALISALSPPELARLQQGARESGLKLSIDESANAFANALMTELRRHVG